MAQILNNTYEILDFIGRGGMSTVFKARHIRMDTVVAVKSVRKDQAVDMKAEVGILTKLNHPNLVRVLDVFEDDKLIYIVMDYIEGEDLQHIIRREKVIPEDTLTDWFITLADILSYLHSRKPPVIYRDMKPANIILQKDGSLKLVDFGIAREYKASATGDTNYIGTNGFAAPEQFGLAQTDGRTDIYSLGMTMYYLATGKSPLEPPYTYVPARQLNPRISEKLENILDRCMKFNPEERYQSADELLEDLTDGATLPFATASILRRRDKAADGTFADPAGTEGSEKTGGSGKGKDTVIHTADKENVSAVKEAAVPKKKPASLYAGIAAAVLAVIAGIFFITAPKRPAEVPAAETAEVPAAKTDADVPGEKPEGTPVIPSDSESAKDGTAESVPDASGQSASRDVPLSEKVLRVGFSQKSSANGIEGVFNPLAADKECDSYICSLLFDGLADYDPEGGYVQELADWEVSEDGKIFTFRLKDAVFSNGSPVTAEDVAFTYNTLRELDYAGPYDYIGEIITGIQVIDDRTIAFKLEGTMYNNMRCFTLGILDDEYYAHSSYDELMNKNGEPMGCGIVTLENWQEQDHADLVRNDSYYGNPLPYRGISFMEMPQASLPDELAAGSLDLIRYDPMHGEEIRVMPDTHIVDYPAGLVFLCFNTTRPNLADVRVRQALLYGFDEEAYYRETVDFEAKGSLNAAPASPASYAYPGDDVLNPYAYDPEKAAQLLDEAGWLPDPVTHIRGNDVNGDGTVSSADHETMQFEWHVPDNANLMQNLWIRKMAETAAENWGRIGVEVNIVYDGVRPGTNDTDFDLHAQTASFSNDSAAITYLLSNTGLNSSGWVNNDTRSLYSRASREPDQDTRAELFREVILAQNEEVPVFSVIHINNIWGVRDDVHGLDAMNIFTDFTQYADRVTFD
ncbi:MAG: protein kinase [Solobacterium sp.]|nr:protein kinase [Solobacterium sp.]